MYKLVKNELTNQVNSVLRLSDNTNIPMVYANTDYRNFKKEINEETAELQEAEGDTMTAAEAKAYVATLP